MKLISNEYNLKSNKIKKSINIYHLTDIHYTYFTSDKLLKKIINSINNIKPNYIVLTGDLIDSPKRIDQHSLDKLYSFLEYLTKTNKLIYILGNHELKCNNESEFDIYPFLNKLRKLNNLYLLDKDKPKVVFDDITIYTVDLDLEYYYVDLENNKERIRKNINDITKDMDINKYNILLSHTPSIVKDKEYFKNKSFDLILTGHMHNGLIPNYINYRKHNFGILSPRKKLFPKYSRNMFDISNTHILVGYPICFNHLIDKYNLEFVFRPGINIINIKRNI